MASEDSGSRVVQRILLRRVSPSLEPTPLLEPPAFPADCPHRTDCHYRNACGSTAGYSGFPANSQLHSMRHRIEGQHPGTSGSYHLRTVIVQVVPHIAMGPGPYLHPRASNEELCVWPLRIPNPATPRGSLHRCAGAFPLGSSDLAREDLSDSLRSQMPS